LKNGWQRKARQLLLDPRGRAALKEFGIDVELVSDEKKFADIPVVAILVPSYRAPEPQMQDAISKMIEYTREKSVAAVYYGPPSQAISVVHWSRNRLLTEHLKSGKPWTHVLFIDDDIVVQPDALERLLSHKKDITAGLCTFRSDPPIPNMRGWNEELGEAQQAWIWKEGQLIQGMYAGTGLMLLSKNALEQVAQSYFDCLWEQDFYGLAGEKLERVKQARLAKFDEGKVCYWFRFIQTTRGDNEMGEDMGFCHLAKTYCQMETWIDSSVKPGHIGKYPYSVKDFEPYREECILRAKIDGTYPMEIPPMKISILCPTRGRPEMVKSMWNSLRETSSVMPEIVYYVDEDDGTFPESFHCFTNVNVLRGPRILMTEMWNRCAEAATGEIMLLSGDDVLFKTKGWDDMVRRAFAAFPDRLVMVHGDDGIWGNKFGTHCFLHRAWVDAVGYFSPPYFSSDYGDTWINDVFNAVNRRIYLPFVTEHLHPVAGKRKLDKTDEERLQRHKKDGVQKLYADLAHKRLGDTRNVEARLGIPWKEKEPVINDFRKKGNSDERILQNAV
jgi:hypothetical protein